VRIFLGDNDLLLLAWNGDDCMFCVLWQSVNWVCVVAVTEGGTPPAASTAGLTAPPAGSTAQGMC